MTDSTDPLVKEEFDADAYNANVDVVRRRLIIVEKSQEELKTQKEMLESMFVNDAQYQIADEKVAEAQKDRKPHKARISSTPAAQNLLTKIKDLRVEIAENKALLSQDLMQYYQTAGVTEIEDAQGNVQEFEIVVKLRKKRNNK